MKKIIAISLSFLILSIAMKDLITYAHFQINRTQIAEIFCINKSLPELKCKGKCHLAKTLQKNTEESKDLPVSNTEEKTNTTYLIPSVSTPSIVVVSRNRNPFTEQKDDYSLIHSSNIFHPPQLG